MVDMFVNSVYLDQMHHSVASDLGLQYANYPFMGLEATMC